ncbi:hypothetical protein BaRGS_00033713 [Batillaria attramentaria]|uniref:Uncharacterized protein n=1 Tax=Batillaria attramentaria TaxID=370345 RepID=A0ABD0JJA0_9CAEN
MYRRADELSEGSRKPDKSTCRSTKRGIPETRYIDVQINQARDPGNQIYRRADQPNEGIGIAGCDEAISPMS